MVHALSRTHDSNAYSEAKHKDNHTMNDGISLSLTKYKRYKDMNGEIQFPCIAARVEYFVLLGKENNHHMATKIGYEGRLEQRLKYQVGNECQLVSSLSLVPEQGVGVREFGDATVGCDISGALLSHPIPTPIPSLSSVPPHHPTTQDVRHPRHDQDPEVSYSYGND
jgi:hypothetical protein